VAEFLLAECPRENFCGIAFFDSAAEALRQMAAVKYALDPALVLGMGNLFDEKMFL